MRAYAPRTLKERHFCWSSRLSKILTPASVDRRSSAPVRANGHPLQGSRRLTDVLWRGHVRTSGHENSFQYPSSVVVATARATHPTV